MRGQYLQLLVGILRFAEFDQLNLIELMLANQTSRILAIGACFTAKAGSVGDEIHGEVFCRQDFIREDIGHGNFGGGNQKVVGSFHMKQVGFKLGQVARSKEAAAVGHKGWEDLQITMLPGVNMQHEVHEGPFQKCPRAVIVGKSSSRNFSSPLRIKNSQIHP